MQSEATDHHAQPTRRDRRLISWGLAVVVVVAAVLVGWLRPASRCGSLIPARQRGRMGIESGSGGVVMQVVHVGVVVWWTSSLFSFFLFLFDLGEPLGAGG